MAGRKEITFLLHTSWITKASIDHLIIWDTEHGIGVIVLASASRDRIALAALRNSFLNAKKCVSSCSNQCAANKEPMPDCWI